MPTKGFLNALFVNVVGILFPAYASFKAIESTDKHDDTRWLVYWVVFATFLLFEGIADFLVSWLPLYYELKLAFLVLLQLPQYEFALVLYRDHMRPFLVKNEAAIDANIQELREKGLAKIGEDHSRIAKAVGGAVAGIVQSASNVAKNKAAAAAESKTEQIVHGGDPGHKLN